MAGGAAAGAATTSPGETSSGESINTSGENYDYEKGKEKKGSANPESAGEFVFTHNEYADRWQKFSEEILGDQAAPDWDSTKEVPFRGINHLETMGKTEDNNVNSQIKDIVGEEEYQQYNGFYSKLDSLDVSNEYKEKLANCYSRLDTDIKAVYNGYSERLECLDAQYLGTAHFNSSEGGFKFSEVKDVAKGLGEGNTFFHESAHMIDWLAGIGGINASQLHNLADVAQIDYENAIYKIMQREKCTRDKAQSILSKELWDDPIASNCVSDIFGGLSDNKVVGLWGHSIDYWKKRDRAVIGKEAFAEITADIACNSCNIAFTQKYMPRTINVYKTIIKSIKGRINI